MLIGASSSLLPLKLMPHSGHSSGTNRQKMSLWQWLNLITLLSIDWEHGAPAVSSAAKGCRVASCGLSGSWIEFRLLCDVHTGYSSVTEWEPSTDRLYQIAHGQTVLFSIVAQFFSTPFLDCFGESVFTCKEPGAVSHWATSHVFREFSTLCILENTVHLE